MNLLRLLCIFLSFSVFSQNQSADVENLRLITKSDTASYNSKVNAQNEIIAYFSERGEDSLTMEEYMKLAQIHARSGLGESSAAIIDTLLLRFSDIPIEDSIFYVLRKSSFLKGAGKTDESIKIKLDLLAYYEDNKILTEAARMNSQIGITFLKMSEYENAEYHLKEAIEQADEVGDLKQKASSLMSLGNRYKYDSLLYDKAKESYFKSIEIAKANDFKRILAGNYNNFGSLLRKFEKYSEAKEYYQKAVLINKELKNKSWLSYNYNNLGNIADQEKQYDLAIEYFTKSLQIKRELGEVRSLVYTYKNLANIYEKKGDYTKAFNLLDRSITMKDSIYEVDKVSESKMIAAQFQAEQREAKILQLNMQDELNQKEIEARDERISYQNFLGWLMGVGVFLALIVMVLLLISARNRKKANKVLMDKNEQIDRQHNEIIDSINYAQRIQESILPSDLEIKKSLPNYAIYHQPKDIVSGDFYVCETNQNGIYFGTVDCTGHGVPGAMVSLVVSSAIKKALNELNISEPGDVLKQLNEDVPQSLKTKEGYLNDGADMAFCRILPDDDTLQFAGANLNCWILTQQKNIVTSEKLKSQEKEDFVLLCLQGNRNGIGKSTEVSIYETIEYKLQKGDKIILTSDGFVDQFGGPKNKKYKVKQFREILLNNRNAAPSELKATLHESLTTWKGSKEQIDDISVFIVEY